MRHDTETRKGSKSLYGVTVLLGRARKAERKKQGVALGVEKIHRFHLPWVAGDQQIRTS